MRKLLIIFGSTITLLGLFNFMPVFADCSTPPTASNPASPASLCTAKIQACSGVSLLTPGATNCDSQTSGFNSILQTVLGILSLIVGITAVIMIVLAGFKYITSGGDSNALASAKGTLIFAIVGLIIAALAQFIVHVVLSKFSQ